MRKGDRVLGFICLGLSLWLILESTKYDYVTRFTPGPGFLPFWLGICLGLLSLYLIYDTFKRKASTREEAPRLPGKKSLWRVCLILLFTAGLALSMKILGFVLTVTIFAFLILIVLERYPFFKSTLYSAIMGGAVFVIACQGGATAGSSDESRTR